MKKQFKLHKRPVSGWPVRALALTVWTRPHAPGSGCSCPFALLVLLRFLKASGLPTENPALPSAPSPSPLSCQSCLPELSASLSLQPAWSQPSSPRVVSALALTVFPGALPGVGHGRTLRSAGVY